MQFPVKPVPKARHQARLSRGKVITYTPQRTRKYENAVRMYSVQKIQKQEGDVGVIVDFYTNGRGDIDNLIKSLLDGLNGAAWEDDCQVKTVLASKRSCPRGKERTEVVIMSNEQLQGRCESYAKLCEGAQKMDTCRRGIPEAEL